MANEITIPALPCASINDTLEFYVGMGFEITYQTSRPNNYGVVKYEDFELHFFTMKGYEPQNSYSTCLVIIEDPDALYQVFAANLKAHFGKLPATGIPRITRPNNKNASGDYRFNVVDPGGNWIRFIQKGTAQAQDKAPKERMTKFGRTMEAASFMVSGKGDFPAAAKMLDNALEQAGTVIERAKALVLRAEVALNLSDQVLARRLLDELHQLPLSEAEQLELSEPLQRAEELAEMLDSPESIE